jgi:hypothetical protein
MQTSDVIIPNAAMPDPETIESGAEIESEVDMGQIMLRPDGYHWQAPDGKQEFGPFESLELALADMMSADPDSAEPGESLEEAEGELGIADWIDPETGAPAEGMSTPHLHDE